MPVWMQDITRKDVSDKEIRAFVENQLNVDIVKGFVSVKSANFGEVVVAFNCDKWLEANFLKDPKVFFEIPRTLVWYFRYLLPATLTSHVEGGFIQQFITVRFKNFLKSHHKSIFAEKMKIMKVANMDWFTYDVDLQMNKITIRVKASVLLTLMIGANVAKNVLGTNKDQWS